MRALSLWRFSGAVCVPSMKRATLLLCALALAPSTPLREAEAQIAVIVNPGNPVRDLSRRQLRQLYLGRITAFPGGGGAVLAEFTPLRRKFYELASRMTVNEVRRHWIRVVFSGESARPPTEFSEVDEIKRFVSRNPGAIGFIDWSDLDDGVKVLTIEGLMPGDARYVLR